ncbi:RagB/SusD family nutrient uptake outer membrane protein [uncultured Arcticibacterium sp.]|uniref:RagB/SusD family nutrient uptake outer membrane protein n=1 Tax=uncultured Arcticibacterium sp. TaxID=2173042 RepID=UPI0030FC3B75
MKKTIILLILAVFTQTGCKDDFLELVPATALSSATFFTKEADFEQAVNGAYVPLRDIFNSRSWLLSEMHSDNTYYARNILFGATEQQEDLADFADPTSNGLSTNTHVLNQYRLDYQIIARTNQILSQIDDVDFDAANKANLKGQTQFLRAFAYFELARYFGKAPLHLEPVTDREGAALPLTEEAGLYQQVISDAQAAISSLPTKANQEPGRVTKGAAQMLLANVYIIQKNWSGAEALLREIVNSGEYALMPTYGEAFSDNNSNKNNQESIFEVQFLEGSAGLNGNFIYSFLPRPISPSELEPIMGTSNPQPINGEGNNIPTPDIIAAYEDGDLRKDESIAYVTLEGSLRSDKTYPYIKKYAKKHSLHNNTGTNWPVYRYSEALLFLSEVLIEQNKTSEALPFLNQVRSRAGLGNTPATSQDELRTAIANERRVELAFENKRWFDLVRTGKAIETITAYGNRIKADPFAYYYPEGAEPRGNAFSNISLYYGLPAAEADLSPHF